MSEEANPKTDGLKRRLAGLTPERRALVERLMRERSHSPEAIPKRPAVGDVPLSFAQQRIWFLDQLAPGNPFYNEQMGIGLPFGIDESALPRAVNEIIRRHEILRTTFPTRDGRPRQEVHPAFELPVAVVDLTELPPAEREPELARRLRLDARTPFDLTALPLLRVTLLRRHPKDWIFVVTMHHIVCDGWSMPIFFNELMALGAAFSKGLPSPLPDLAVQYGDFAVWQRDWLRGEVLAEQLDYWRRRLDGLSLLQLPTDRPHPRIPTYQGGRLRADIPERVEAGLDALAKAENATLFMVLLAAFQVLLFRYSGQNDVAVGIPVANRTRKDLEPLIGFFVNSLVARVDLSGRPSFREVVGRVRKLALEAYAHQDVPFERLVEELHPQRDTARNPLFQVIFQYFPTPGDRSQGADLGLPAEESRSKFDLQLDVFQAERGLTAYLQYSADLFDESTIRRMGTHFRNLLAAVAESPDTPILELPLLDEAERHLLLKWSGGPASPQSDTTIAERFQLQVGLAPEAVAVVDGGEAWSYQRLNRHANRVAATLIESGIGPEDVVGITTRRSGTTVAGLLGILKAGAAYLPLDPSLPEERLLLTVADCPVVAVLHSTDELASLGGGVRLIQIPDCPDDPEWDANPGLAAAPESLAYVMPTSGSTGTPKGVAVTHRGVARLVVEPNYARLGPGETILWFAPLAFDASTFEIWGALLNGGRLAVHPDRPTSLEELGRAILESGATTLWLTSSLFRQMVDSQLHSLRGLRQLLAGGDRLPPLQAGLAARGLPGCRIVNGYGPTENTTFTCTCEVSADEGFAGGVPIGRPVSGTQAWVLDRAGRLSPVGVPGELWIGGAGLARGYHGSFGLTADRFIPSPFSPGERLYRSGDLARWLGDGRLEFLGRLDDQVKIRGFRIEPGEIEVALRACPEVADCVVAARAESDGDKRLVAYVVGRGPLASRELIARLRERLGRKLPDYMIPSSFVMLEEIPLNPSGKVNRSALPAPSHARVAAASQSFVAPRNEIERRLAEIWSGLLSVDRVGVRDDFFQLGGHSLLATQVVSRIRAALGVELPLRRLFETPTVEGLALAVSEADGEPGGEGAPPSITPADSAFDIDDLSDDEVDEMLRQILKERETK